MSSSVHELFTKVSSFFLLAKTYRSRKKRSDNNIPVGCEPFIQTGEFVPQCNGGTQYSGMR